jgi:hypothetical protein
MMLSRTAREGDMGAAACASRQHAGSEGGSGVPAVGGGAAGTKGASRTQGASARAYGRKKLASCSGASELGQGDTGGSARSSTVSTNINGVNRIPNVIPGAPIVVKGADSSDQQARIVAAGRSGANALASLLTAAGGAGWTSLKIGAGALGMENGVMHVDVEPMMHATGVIPGAPIVVKRGATPSACLSHHASAITHLGSLDSKHEAREAIAARKRERPSTAGSDQGGLVVKPGIGVGVGLGAGEEDWKGGDDAVGRDKGSGDGEGDGDDKGEGEIEEWELQALKEQQELLALEMRIWEHVQYREQQQSGRDDEEQILLQVREGVRVRASMVRDRRGNGGREAGRDSKTDLKTMDDNEK